MTDMILGPFPAENRYADSAAADAADPLAPFRELFEIADPDQIYLDGNSLGRLPRATKGRIADVVTDEWGKNLIESWGDRWWALGRTLGAQIAPLIGADPAAVVVADSTSVALFKLAWGALRVDPSRSVIVTDDLNFPTDLYVLTAAAEAAGGRRLEVVPSPDGVATPEDDIVAALDGETALLSLSHVSFKSGALYNMDRLTRAAHDVGALVLWDLSHSAGVVQMDLSQVDLAVGCTYKYLNGGPGAPAFLYVNPDLEIDNPLTGWWGHTNPFSFDLQYRSADSIARFQTGTMPILSLAAVEPAIHILAEAGIAAIRAKSVALTGLLIDLADEMLTPLGFEIATPRDADQRGSHVALRHARAWPIVQAMVREAKLVPDFREPNNIRLGVSPLYTRFVDIHTAVHRIARLATSDAIDRYPETRSSVT